MEASTHTYLKWRQYYLLSRFPSLFWLFTRLWRPPHFRKSTEYNEPLVWCYVICTRQITANLSHAQEQMHMKTVSLSAASQAASINIHKWEIEISKYKTVSTNQIKFDSYSLWVVGVSERWLWQTRAIGCRCEVTGLQIQDNLSTTDEHLQLKTAVGQQYSHNFQHRRWDSSDLCTW